jgi:hypothetical protein
MHKYNSHPDLAATAPQPNYTAARPKTAPPDPARFNVKYR